MTTRIAAAVLAASLAGAASAQDIGHPDWSPEQKQTMVLNKLAKVSGAINAQITLLDGTVVPDIVKAGDGRLALLDAKSNALVKGETSMLDWSCRIIRDGARDPAPYQTICRELTNKPCGFKPGDACGKGGATGDVGYLSSLNDDRARLTAGLKLMRAKKGRQPASDACDDAKGDRSPTRAAARATTHLAINAQLLYTALQDGGVLAGALNAINAQGQGKSKAEKESRVFYKTAKAKTRSLNNSFMQALTAPEKATGDDLAKLKEAAQKSEEASGNFTASQADLHDLSDPLGPSDEWNAINGLMLDLGVMSGEANDIRADLTPMSAEKKTYLVHTQGSGDHITTYGIFPGLRHSEEAVRHACGIREGISRIESGKLDGGPVAVVDPPPPTDGPITPTTPTTPTHPEHPTHPTHPTPPTHPEHPTHPTHPTHPATHVASHPAGSGANKEFNQKEAEEAKAERQKLEKERQAAAKKVAQDRKDAAKALKAAAAEQRKANQAEAKSRSLQAQIGAKKRAADAAVKQEEAQKQAQLKTCATDEDPAKCRQLAQDYYGERIKSLQDKASAEAAGLKQQLADSQAQAADAKAAQKADRDQAKAADDQAKADAKAGDDGRKQEAADFNAAEKAERQQWLKDHPASSPAEAKDREDEAQAKKDAAAEKQTVDKLAAEDRALQQKIAAASRGPEAAVKRLEAEKQAQLKGCASDEDPAKCRQLAEDYYGERIKSEQDKEAAATADLKQQLADGQAKAAEAKAALEADKERAAAAAAKAKEDRRQWLADHPDLDRKERQEEAAEAKDFRKQQAQARKDYLDQDKKDDQAAASLRGEAAALQKTVSADADKARALQQKIAAASRGPEAAVKRLEAEKQAQLKGCAGDEDPAKCRQLAEDYYGERIKSEQDKEAAATADLKQQLADDQQALKDAKAALADKDAELKAARAADRADAKAYAAARTKALKDFTKEEKAERLSQPLEKHDQAMQQAYKDCFSSGDPAKCDQQVDEQDDWYRQKHGLPPQQHSHVSAVQVN